MVLLNTALPTSVAKSAPTRVALSCMRPEKKAKVLIFRTNFQSQSHFRNFRILAKYHMDKHPPELYSQLPNHLYQHLNQGDVRIVRTTPTVGKVAQMDPPYLRQLAGPLPTLKSRAPEVRVKLLADLLQAQKSRHPLFSLRRLMIRS